ncbi:MAG: 16S rRNA (adenine(1518)-N(6)/adenine(1519)-N(6))-dimethyltransferase RsmA [Thermoplasmata archaeon]
MRRTLEALGVRPARRWGQSFLTDPFVADAEAALVGLPPGRPVVEIGGGLGVLTAALLRRGLGPLTVIERDRRLAAFLDSVFGERIRVVPGDALEIDLPSTECVVGNLPYSAATPILVRLLERRTPRVVFLIQREVAERLAAAPGSKRYGRLALLGRLYGDVELFRTVPAASFAPVPEVDGRLGVHVARPGPLPVPSVATFERAVRLLFASRRKQLGNLLPRLAGGATAAAELARRAGWPSEWATRRPESLPAEAFFALARALDAPD